MVSISSGNVKMGKISSVSLPVGKTCRPDAPCYKKCYARRMEYRRSTIKNAYQKNLDLLENDPDAYWREVEGVIMLSRFFRFHVSGDIPDRDYLEHMMAIAERNPHCEILCFTKKYELVNEYLDDGFSIPENMHMVFSVWSGLSMENPHGLPEAHVKYKDGSTTAREDAVPCGGNCTTCASTNCGCWVLKNGQQVVFNEH